MGSSKRENATATKNKSYPFQPKVAPLRVSKASAAAASQVVSDKIKTKSSALQEVSPVSSRRNSPSHILHKEQLAEYKNSSPTKTHVPKSDSTSSMRNFWVAMDKGEVEEGEVSAPKPARDTEILDTIKKTSRVRNNSILANDRRNSISKPVSPARSPSKTPGASMEGADKDILPSVETKQAEIELPEKGDITTEDASVSPGPSLLVNRRLHGPREELASEKDEMNASARRKTVTFDEDLKVVTFQRQISESQSMSSQPTESAVDDSETDDSLDTPTESKAASQLPARPLPQIPSEPKTQRQVSLLAKLQESVKDKIETEEKKVKNDQSQVESFALTAAQLDEILQQEDNGSSDIFGLYGVQSPILKTRNSCDADEMSHYAGSPELSMSNSPKVDSMAEIGRSLPLLSFNGSPELPEIFANFGLDPEEKAILAKYIHSHQMVSATSIPPIPKSPDPLSNALLAQVIEEGKPDVTLDPLKPHPLCSTSLEVEHFKPSPLPLPDRETSDSVEKVQPESASLNDSMYALSTTSTLLNVPPSSEPGKVNKENSGSMSTAGSQFHLDAPSPIDTSFSDLDAAFDRNGYLVRQNTKIVHASNNEGSAMLRPVSVNFDNAQVKEAPERRSMVKGLGIGIDSVDLMTASPKESVLSNDSKLTSSSSEQSSTRDTASVAKSTPTSMSSSLIQRPYQPDSRLFVRVKAIHGLVLPITEKDNQLFSCTLDNGEHFVASAWRSLYEGASIDQEFELLATDDLEFMLTLGIKMPKLPLPETVISRPTSTFGKLFTSPKKHKVEPSLSPAAAALKRLEGAIGRDGSFGRAKVPWKLFVERAYGRPLSVRIPLLNEWAVHPEVPKSNQQLQSRRIRPYPIGNLEIILCYIPGIYTPQLPLPKSIQESVRELATAESHLKTIYEGFLSQQGGDCKHWRRRYFELTSGQLIAYHETTRTRRAVINLVRAKKILDDKASLLLATPQVGRNRRKSAFSKDEEGYMYLEEGFRILFANGEVLDFYAESVEVKGKWMKMLQDIIGKVEEVKPWAEAVLDQERGKLREAAQPK